jgi:SAM-dependent methyltransferase
MMPDEMAYWILLSLGLVALSVVVAVARPWIHQAIMHLLTPTAPMTLRDRIIARYRGKDFYAWNFAVLKTRMDPMFAELPEYLKAVHPLESFLDLGCGFGIAGSMVVELFQRANAFGIDPNPVRVRAAAAAMGNRGRVFDGAAPDFEKPEFPAYFDAVFALDMMHFLTDAQIDLTLERIRSRLHTGGWLFLRCPVKPIAAPSFKLRIYLANARLHRTNIMLREVEEIRHRISQAGFALSRCNMTGNNPELFWFIGTAR